MDLKQLLSQKRLFILDRWLRLICESYPGEAAKSVGRNSDRFSNPVGYVLAHEIEALYDGLLQGKEGDQISVPLEKVMQIRSVQDFSPSQAVAVIPLLKMAIYEELRGGENDLQPILKEWFEFESRIDRLSLLAFDIYSKYRERINEIRLNEVRKERDRTLRLLERMNPGPKGQSKPVG
jgi:hypothetical protein